MIAISKIGKRALYILREIDSKGKVLRKCGQAFMMFDEDLENQQLLVFSSSSALQPSTDNSTTIQAVRYHKPWNKAAKTLTINTNNIETCAEGAVSFIRFPGNKVSKYQLMCSHKLNPVETFQTERRAHAVVFDGQGTRDLKFTLDESGDIKLKSKARFNLEKLNGAPIMWKVPRLHIGGVRHDQVIGLLSYDNDQLRPVFFELDTFTQINSAPVQGQVNKVQEQEENDRESAMSSTAIPGPSNVSVESEHVQGQEKNNDSPDMPSTSSQDSSKFSAQDVELRSKNLKSSTKRQTEFQPKLMAIHSVSSAKTDDIFTNLTIQRGRKPLQKSGYSSRDKQLSEYSQPTGTPIKACQEIFLGPEHDTPNSKSILVIGKAGIGKSLFCQKLVRDWANDVLFQNKSIGFEFVYLLTFRQLNLLWNEELNLLEILNRSSLLDEHSNIDESLFEYLMQHPGNVLFILDGYDEYAHRKDICANLEQKYSNDPRCTMPVTYLISKLVKKKVFTDATVMVTSRPQQADELGGMNFDAVVEIAGFSPEQVKEFIGKYFKSTHETIKNVVVEHVVKHKNLLSVAHIPVVCFLVCWCLEWNIESQKEKDFTYYLPVTITELYSEFVRILEMKHHSKSEYRTSEIPSEYTVPPIVESTLDKLSKLAAETIMQKRFIFQESDLKKFGITSEEAEVLKASGLLTCGPGFRETPFKIRRYFSFSHLTFHEYFAALQFVRNSEIPPEIVLESSIVSLFMSGLLVKERNEELMANLITAVSSETQNILRPAKCLYEYQNQEFGVEMIKKYYHRFCNKNGNLSCGYADLSEVDCIAVSFFLNLISEFCKDSRAQAQDQASSSRPFIITGFDCNINTVEGGQRIIDSLKSKSSPITSLQWSCINEKLLKYLIQALPSTNITELDMSDNDITDVGLQYISQALPSTQLTRLSLTSTNITDVGIQCLCQSLPSTNITRLDLISTSITDTGLQYLGQALSSTNLTILVLYHNNITDVGLQYLSQALPSSNITALDLRRTNIMDVGLQCLSQVLPSTSITRLFLGCTNITDVGLQHLSQVLPSTSMTRLGLNCKNISEEGLQHLSQVLPSTNITRLGLNCTNISEAGLQHLSQVLPSTNITRLDLYNATIFDIGVKYLSQAFPVKTITILSTSDSISLICRRQTLP